MIDDPQVAKDLVIIENQIKASRNEAGWNVAYTAGKIIEQIGPILAINKKDDSIEHVVEKFN